MYCMYFDTNTTRYTHTVWVQPCGPKGTSNQGRPKPQVQGAFGTPVHCESCHEELQRLTRVSDTARFPFDPWLQVNTNSVPHPSQVRVSRAGQAARECSQCQDCVTPALEPWTHATLSIAYAARARSSVNGMWQWLHSTWLIMRLGSLPTIHCLFINKQLQLSQQAVWPSST